ncbi:MAG: FAD-dependent oxidoreductase [Planctomycetes bacterium]|nr:FAD-dependent oxidoreductase [Planctomycetota bacterium]
MKLEDTAPQYDAVVIGGGIGGMTAANRLAKFGHKVLLLEHHFELGGLAAYFKRKGFIFDTALHGFPVGMIKTCRKYWSKEIADCIVQVDSIRYDNPQFCIDTTYTTEDFTDKLINFFKVTPETVESFFKACQSMDFFDDREKTTLEFFEEYFPGRSDIHRFLMEPIHYANGSTFLEPAITYGIVFSNFMSKGVYFFTGGTDLFVKMCREEMEKNGVDIVMQATVEKILLENGKVAGVVANGKEIKTKSVLSNANLKATCLDMIGAENLPADFAASCKEMRLSTSNSQVFIGIKEGVTLPFIGDIIFHSSAESFAPEEYIHNPPHSRSFSIYYPKCRPGYDRYAIAASMGARMSDWENLSDEEYEKAKENLIEQTLSILEQKLVPNIREITEYVEAATPRTFQRYTLHKEGATFGTKFEGLKVSEDLPKAVPGAYHAGSVAIIMSGWLGAANYGVIVANQLDEYLCKA